MTDQPDSLIVILGQQVKLATGGPWPIASFISNGKCFRDCGFGEFTEFYDWLRNSRDARCIGMPSVVKVRNRLAPFYDAPSSDTRHMKRDIGMAWLSLPLKPPA